MFDHFKENSSRPLWLTTTLLPILNRGFCETKVRSELVTRQPERLPDRAHIYFLRHMYDKALPIFTARKGARPSYTLEYPISRL